MGLAYYQPLGDLLTVCGHLEQDLYTGPYGNVAHWSAREMGVHLDARIILQHDYRQVERLIFLKQSDRAIIYDAIIVDLATAAHGFSLQLLPRATLATN